MDLSGSRTAPSNNEEQQSQAAAPSPGDKGPGEESLKSYLERAKFSFGSLKPGSKSRAKASSALASASVVEPATVGASASSLPPAAANASATSSQLHTSSTNTTQPTVSVSAEITKSSALESMAGPKATIQSQKAAAASIGKSLLLSNFLNAISSSSRGCHVTSSLISTPRTTNVHPQLSTLA